MQIMVFMNTSVELYTIESLMKRVVDFFQPYVQTTLLKHSIYSSSEYAVNWK